MAYSEQPNEYTHTLTPTTNINGLEEYIDQDTVIFVETSHIKDRIENPSRIATRNLIRTTIENGTITSDVEGGSGDWWITNVYAGVRFNLVCGIGGELEVHLVTAFAEVEDEQIAKRSERWDTSTIHQIKLWAGMSAKHHHDESLTDIKCASPVEMFDHSIVTKLGWDHVKCVTCGKRTDSKGVLERTPCDN